MLLKTWDVRLTFKYNHDRFLRDRLERETDTLQFCEAFELEETFKTCNFKVTRVDEWNHAFLNEYYLAHVETRGQIEAETYLDARKKFLGMLKIAVELYNIELGDFYIDEKMMNIGIELDDEEW